MASEQDLQNSLDRVKVDVGKVSEKLSQQADLIKQLQAQIAEGVPVTQEQLDFVASEASALADGLDALLAPPSN